MKSTATAALFVVACSANNDFVPRELSKVQDMEGADVAQAAMDRTILAMTPAVGKRNDKAAGRGLKGKKGKKS